MIADLRVVEDALVRLDPVVIQDLCRQGVVVIAFTQRLQRLLDRRQIIFRQVLGICSRVGQHFVLFVQCLRKSQRVLGRETEARIGLSLQAGQVEQRRRHRGAGLGFFGDIARFAAARGDDGFGGGLAPQALCFFLRIGLVFFERGIEPAAFVDATCADELGTHFPEIAWDELLDLFFALNHDR